MDKESNGNQDLENIKTFTEKIRETISKIDSVVKRELSSEGVNPLKSFEENIIILIKEALSKNDFDDITIEKIKLIIEIYDKNKKRRSS